MCGISQIRLGLSSTNLPSIMCFFALQGFDHRSVASSLALCFAGGLFFNCVSTTAPWPQASCWFRCFAGQGSGQTSPGDEVKNEDVKAGSFLEWHAWVL
eukprot:symbB.v1.2.040639.t2/scaffold7332.1/size11880/1